MKVEDFIGTTVFYNPDSGTVVGSTKQGPQPIVDVRGWGRMKNFLGIGSTSKDFETAEKFHDEVGEWIADAINQKLKKTT